MESRTKVTKGMKGTLAAIILLVGVFASRTQATNVYCGGTVPLINQLITFGNTGLDLTSLQANAVVAYFYISNNAPNSFDFTVTLKYGGEFIKINGADGSGLDWTAANLHHAGGGTLGAGAAALNPAVNGLITPIAAAGGATAPVDWVGGAVTTATVNYEVDLRASWDGTAGTLLAGVYIETVIATLVADM